MVVAHNLLAANTNRQLGIVTGNKKKSTERLASGYRINRSADDAAGLSISEKMRWQIRGLDRGAINIMDGISLIDTADGALEEVHSILQRTRELTIQAYNDTNTPTDRNAIQSEIDSCLKEIKRIADDTMFNTKPILQGNPIETVKVSEDMSVDYVSTVWVTKDLPSWLDNSVDKKMEVHDSYMQLQDTSGVMLKYDGINDSSKWYFGPADADVPDGYQWGGGWSDEIKNNPSSKLDFSKLTNTQKAFDLYKNMYELVGCKIAYPCGTCSQIRNSISYGGHVGDLSTQGFDNFASIDVGGNLDLSKTKFTYNGKTYDGYFEAIEEVVNKYGANYDSDATNNVSGEEAEVQALSKSIAKDLRDKTADILGAVTAPHFDRVVKGDDDYSLIVYDYRDNTPLTNLNAADSDVITSGKVCYKVKTRILQPGTIVDAESTMKIMCGAKNSSYINLLLPDLTSLNLSDYSVNRYTMEEAYSDSYKAKLQAWEDSAIEVVTTHMEEFPVVDQFTPAVWGTRYVNGEAERFQISKASITFKTEMRPVKVTEKQYGPKPVAQPGDIVTKMVYKPSSVDIIDDAISRVSADRSLLGATKNRLEYAYNINNNTSENSQAAESRIRDTDMAEEMVNFSKHNILEQAGQSMLAQANQSTQGILSLIQ